MWQDEQLPIVAGCYVIYLDGELAYVGQTINLRARIHHAHEIQLARYSDMIVTPWGRFRNVVIKYRPTVKYGDWAMVELRLIRRLQPRLNRAGIPRKAVACA